MEEMRRRREEISGLLGDGFISRQSPPAEAADRAVDNMAAPVPLTPATAQVAPFASPVKVRDLRPCGRNAPPLRMKAVGRR